MFFIFMLNFLDLIEFSYINTPFTLIVASLSYSLGYSLQINILKICYNTGTLTPYFRLISRRYYFYNMSNHIGYPTKINIPYSPRQTILQAQRPIPQRPIRVHTLNPQRPSPINQISLQLLSVCQARTK